MGCGTDNASGVANAGGARVELDLELFPPGKTPRAAEG
jgi:hypothetical protein